MEKIAVFVNDAEYAQQLLAPLLADGAAPVRWVVVACAPRLSHRIGKWVAHASREQWRERWAKTLRNRLAPTFGAVPAASCEWVLARGPLPPLCRQLRQRLGADLRLLDARRPRLGVDLAPLSADATPTASWAAPAAVSTGLSLLLALTD